MPERMLSARIAARCSASLRGLDEQRVGDLGEQLRLAACASPRGADRRVRVRRVALAQRARLARRAPGRRARARPAAACRARRAARPRTSRRAAARRAARRAAASPRSPSEEASASPASARKLLAQRRLVLLGDVLDHVDGQHLAGLVLQRRRLGQEPVQLAGRAVDALRQQRLGRLARGSRARPGSSSVADRPAVRVADLEALGELAGLGGQHGVHAGQAEQRRRRLVGVLDAAAASWTVTASASAPRMPSSRRWVAVQPVDELRVGEREAGAADQQLGERQLVARRSAARSARRRARARRAARRSGASGSAIVQRRRERSISRRSSSSWTIALAQPLVELGELAALAAQRARRSGRGRRAGSTPRASSQPSSSSRSGPSTRAASRRTPPPGGEHVDPGRVGDVGHEQVDQPPQRLVDVGGAVGDPRGVGEQVQLAALGSAARAGGDRGLALARRPRRRSPSRRPP